MEEALDLSSDRIRNEEGYRLPRCDAVRSGERVVFDVTNKPVEYRSTAFVGPSNKNKFNDRESF